MYGLLLLLLTGGAVSLIRKPWEMCFWRKILVIVRRILLWHYKPLFYLRSSLSLYHGASPLHETFKVGESMAITGTNER